MPYPHPLRTSALVLSTALILSSCHTMRFTVDTSEVANVVEERKSFWFWGLTPARTVDVSQHCPQGAVAVKEETTFVDGLFGLITLGIWSPRSSWYYCGAPHEG